MNFSYQAFDRAGKQTQGTIDSPSESEARDKLARQGLFVTSINSGNASRSAKMTSSTNANQRIGGKRLKRLSSFTRQLAILVSTGTPVVDALRTLENQITDDQWQRTISDIRLRVEEGATFSEALATHPQDFGPVARSLIQAGESSGDLQDMLHRLAKLTRQQELIRSSIIGALVYPALLLTISSVVLIMMIVFVLPRFAGLFETLDAPLPPTTEFMMLISSFVRTKWWMVVGGAVVAFVAAVAWKRSAHGQRTLDTFSIKAPIMGKVVRELTVARFVRLLGVLLESKVPLNESLALVRAATTNSHYHAMIQTTEDAVLEGETLSAVLARSDLLPTSLSDSVRNAEQSGKVGQVLCTLADFMDEDNEVVMRSISSLIEPIILIGLGALVAFVAISLFLPLFDLTAMMGA